MGKTVVVCLSGVAAIACIAYWTAQANIESDKQTAFMMKACVDAGGAWSVDWRRNPICARPDKQS